MPAVAAGLERADAIDAGNVSMARSTRLLDNLTWPRALESCFLAGSHVGAPTLPGIIAEPRGYGVEIEALDDIMARCDRGHPMGDHLDKTAWRHATAARMLRAAGTPEFTDRSVRLYG